MDKTLHRLEFRAMGCEILAVVDCESTPGLLAKVPEWFEEWEQVLSRFRYDSELTCLNQIHERPVHISNVLWDVFQAAKKAERLTDGLVTPTLLEAIVEAGYDRSFDMLSHETQYMNEPIWAVSQPLIAVAVDQSTRSLNLPPGMSLDFGGIAKGWAAHETLKRLRSEGPVLVNAGGDIAISGARANGDPWQIGVTNPFQRGQEIETLYLRESGVATSGKDRRRWTRNGILQHHIIDPLTNQPAETDLLTVTVVGPDVMQAEAAAKAAFILGSRAGLEWIEEHSVFAALFILDNGDILYSQKMEEYL